MYENVVKQYTDFSSRAAIQRLQLRFLSYSFSLNWNQRLLFAHLLLHMHNLFIFIFFSLCVPFFTFQPNIKIIAVNKGELCFICFWVINYMFFILIFILKHGTLWIMVLRLWIWPETLFFSQKENNRLGIEILLLSSHTLFRHKRISCVKKRIKFNTLLLPVSWQCYLCALFLSYSQNHHRRMQDEQKKKHTVPRDRRVPHSRALLQYHFMAIIIIFLHFAPFICFLFLFIIHYAALNCTGPKSQAYSQCRPGTNISHRYCSWDKSEWVL